MFNWHEKALTECWWSFHQPEDILFTLVELEDKRRARVDMRVCFGGVGITHAINPTAFIMPLTSKSPGGRLAKCFPNYNFADLCLTRFASCEIGNDGNTI